LSETRKCNPARMEFCLPMLNRILGKFSDGTLQIVSAVDGRTGRERIAQGIYLHQAVDRRPRPLPLRLNFCPWCGAELVEPQASAEPREQTPEHLPHPSCARGATVLLNLPGFLEIAQVVNPTLPAGTIEVWQDGKRLGRIDNIGLR